MQVQNGCDYRGWGDQKVLFGAEGPKFPINAVGQDGGWSELTGWDADGLRPMRLIMGWRNPE